VRISGGITELITQCIRPADEPGTPDMSDAGETTDDGCESPILCVSRTATYAAKAVKCAVPPHNRPEEAGSTEGDEADEADEADGANGADEADDANEADDADEGRDVFDSQGRRFYGPALQANNVMLLDHGGSGPSATTMVPGRVRLRAEDAARPPPRFLDLVAKYLLPGSCLPVFPSSRLPVFPSVCLSGPPHAHAFCLVKPTACACVSV